jgi:uncharacterized protein YqeY
MLINEIKKANLLALKNKEKDARSVISVTLSRYQLLEVEAKAKGNELGDNDLITIIQKVLKELEDERSGYLKVNNLERANSIQNQIDIISKYLPKQLSEEEIREIISKLEDKSIPGIMKHFKANFAGKVNMSLVNSIARAL